VRLNLFKFAVGLTILALPTISYPTNLEILGAAKGVLEIDLFDPKQNGKYVRSIDAKTLDFPIKILEERSLGFIVKLRDGRYYIGASDVITNKTYDTTALCDSSLPDPTASSRGIAGRGCK
jgi:hypothetical protein